MSSTSSSIILTTDPGLEEILLDEWISRTETSGIQTLAYRYKFLGLKGVVKIDINSSLDSLMPHIRKMRTVHHAYRLIHHWDLAENEPIEDIRNTIEQLEIPEMLESKAFRITVLRVGEHAFSTYQIAVAAGAAVQARYGTAVNLEEYDTNIRVNVIGNSCFVDIQLFSKALSFRFDRQLYHNVSLKPTLAYAMLQMAGIDPEDEGPLLDPFCGSGTILMEAGQIYPKLKLMGSDMFPEPLEGAKNNIAQNLEQPDRVHLQQADARRLSESFSENSVPYIVTNPPYGIRVGKTLRFYWFYYHFLDQAHKVMTEDGKLVMLVLRMKFFRDALRNLGLWKIDWSQKIELGGKRVRAYVLTKKGE